MGKKAYPSQQSWGGRGTILLAIAAVMVQGVCLVPSAPAASDGRVYEMVSAPDKNGGDATGVLTTSPDGNRVAYYSSGSFAGAAGNNTINSYVAERGDHGWATHSMGPSVGTAGIGVNGGFFNADFTQDLSKAYVLTRSGAAAEPGVMNVFSRGINDTSSLWVTAPTDSGTAIRDKAYVGRSADGSHFVFESRQQFLPQTTVPGSQVWELVDGHVRLASILPDGSVPQTGAAVGSGINGSIGVGTNFNGTLMQPTVVSEDGRKIIFGLSDTGSTQGVFVRIDGAKTQEVSLSQRTGSVDQPSTSARFADASADGNVIVFTSPDLMTNDATPNGGLYAFDLRSRSLRFLSAGATDPNGAQVDGVSLVSRDGSRVYFVAQAVLVPGKGIAGGHNLYVADQSGVSFIATLSGDDGQDWNPTFGSANARIAKATADGRYFVFQSWDQITATDNHGHQEIYLYDAVQRTLACVSCGPPGHTPSGEASVISNPLPRGGGLTIIENGRSRTITEDGSQIFFQTTDSLVPQDGNHLSDVYGYRTATGAISLISAGTGGYDSEIADNSPDGRDVYFFTRDGLVKSDIDGGAKDVYDARIGGKDFDPPEAPVPCTADSCQPLPKPQAAPQTPGTTESASSTPRDKRAPRLYVHSITATGRKNAVRTGRLTLVLSAEAAGVVRAGGTASYGKHTVYKLKSASVRVKADGDKHLKISLPKAVRTQLKHHHRVKLSITLAYDKATGPVRVALTLS